MEAILIRQVPSSSNPNKVYDVRQGKDGICYCNCPAWKFQKVASESRKPCKHIRAAIAWAARKAAA